MDRTLPIYANWLKFIERAPHRPDGLKHMRVDHRCLQTSMPEQELDRSDISTGGQQMRRKAVAQAMDARMLSNICTLDCLLEGTLNRRIRGVPAYLAAAATPRSQDRGRKYILPGQGC